jgi:Mce-associated membrane protein
MTSIDGPEVAESAAEPEAADDVDLSTRDEPRPDVAATDEAAPGSRRGRGLVVACAVLFVAAVTMAVLAATFYNRYHSQTNDRSQVEQVSGRFSSALLTYDYRNLDKAKAQVLSLATGNFRKDYEANFGALKALLQASKSQSSSTVREIYVAPIEHDATSSFIVLDLTVNGTAGTHRRLSEYVKLDLVKVQSGWRVDGVTNLNLGQQAANPPVSTTTSTTTAK